MTPERIEAIDELIERLLERSESPHPLDEDEVVVVLRCMRELLDTVVAFSNVPTSIPVARDEIRRLDTERKLLRARCREAFRQLEAGEIGTAQKILEAGFMWRPVSTIDLSTEDDDDHA